MEPQQLQARRPAAEHPAAIAGLLPALYWGARGHHRGLFTLVRLAVAHEVAKAALGVPETAALEHLTIRLFGSKTRPLHITNTLVRSFAKDTRDGGLHSGGWPTAENWLLLGDLNAHNSWDPLADPDPVGAELDD